MKAEARIPLSRDRVLRTAVELADASGVEALTMRRLGDELGFEAMSLYRHVASKSDLLDGMLDFVLEEWELPDGRADWRKAIRASASSVHDALRRHPWAAQLLTVTDVSSGSVSSLTPQQQAAIGVRDVSIALSAGAGCGKTFVLTERFMSLLQPATGIQLGQVVAITFTERAAREMRDRIRKACQRKLRTCDDGEVARDHQLEAAGDGVALDHGDGRLGEVEGAIEGARRHLGDADGVVRRAE